MRLKLFSYTLFFATLTALLHILALSFFLYWVFPWLDCVAHFLGGVTIACLITAILRERIPEQRFFWHIVPLVLCVGIAWELFEYGAGLSIHEFNFWNDTLTDIAFDIIGAFFGAALARRILQKSYGGSGK